MTAEKLLSRLDKVKQTGPSKWIACCPVHDDTHPSMAITEIDGKLLLHCFACHAGIDQIVNAIGLSISDLFPHRADFNTSHFKRSYFPAKDVLRCLCHEIRFALICAVDLHKGEKLDLKTIERLQLTVQRLEVACEYT